MALRTLASRKSLALALGAARPLAAARGVATITLPDLPYDHGALEPAISGEIMRLHHQKHHATYVANYNKALEQLDAAISKGDASAVVQLQSAIKFNGGGHVNHSIFWKNLKPISEGGGEPPHGKLGWAIDEDFRSFESLVKKMNAEGAALQGSGWVWLALDKEAKKLSVKTTANQTKFWDVTGSFATASPAAAGCCCCPSSCHPPPTSPGAVLAASLPFCYRLLLALATGTSSDSTPSSPPV